MIVNMSVQGRSSNDQMLVPSGLSLRQPDFSLEMIELTPDIWVTLRLVLAPAVPSQYHCPV